MDMLQIGVDVREACRAQRTGKGQWTAGCVDQLLGRSDVALTLFTDAPLPDAWQGRAATVTFPPGIRWHVRVLSVLRSSGDLDCYLSPLSFLIPSCAPRRIRCVPVVHDLIAFRNEPHDRKAVLLERLTLKRAVRRSAHVLTISDSTKNDLLHRFRFLRPEGITTVFAGPMQEHPQLNISDGKTIACIATLCPRKNQERLICAYNALPDDLRASSRLVLAGARGWQDQAIIRLATSTPGVEWIGYADTATYDRLLGTCAVFALPSLYEGFGLQILDALQRGCVVLTSNKGSLREVAGDAAVIVDPEDGSSIRDGLQKSLVDAALRQTLLARSPRQASRFTWQKTADSLVEAIKKACSLV